MYLDRLEIQGFKSFANKNKLVFSGLINGEKRGLTAIVGPNGSGKSNVADAIRWGLGEQSIKTLRGKRSEDVIFSGSDKKSKLGFAEVSLYLNNNGKSKNKDLTPDTIEKESDLDQIIASCPEITITRRLFRNGDSEYLLNGNRVRLNDIQLLLAKANFGQKTYSVIGQGMVENFLNTSAAERKDFFDEATGVKQFQIKRDSALNKLENSYENFQQVDMLLAEISPRLKSLTRQVDKLNKRSQIETELKTNQLDYYHTAWQSINDKLDRFNTDYLEKEKGKIEKEKKLDKLNQDLNKLKNTDNYQEINELKPQLQELYNAKNQAHKQLVKVQAEIEMNLDAHGQFDLSWLNNKQAELMLELEKISRELSSLRSNFNNPEEQRLSSEMEAINQKIQIASEQLQAINQSDYAPQVREQSQEEIKKIINEFLANLDAIDNEDSLEQVKTILNKIKQTFKDRIKDFLAIENSEKLQEVREVQTKIISLNETKQEIAEQLAECRLKASAHQEKTKLLKEREQELQSDLEGIKNKLAKESKTQSSDSASKEKMRLEESVKGIQNKIDILEKELEALNQAKEQEKGRIFDYQHNLQDLQNDINILNTGLNELKINATRQETKLEDLEANIRNDELNLNEIKGHQPQIEEFDSERIQKKIISLKNQLELIGGIDPETEKEYIDTKERFDFLSSQTADLDKTIKSLEEIIQELDLTIKTRFDKEFKVISEKFNDYFKILFSGGEAKISRIMLEDLEKSNSEQPVSEESIIDEAEEKKQNMNEQLKKIKFLKKYNSVGLAGIDVQATPPGKKIKSVTMLSGGERALTAIALICAIISANPSPFVVLDEVDAALDEANSERLAKILDDLSNKTQFIVVTHNRASMRRASILYGVTMEDDGVSRLLSVKLDDLKQLD